MYPHERSLVKRLADKPFALVGINSDQDRDKLKEAMEKESITFVFARLKSPVTDRLQDAGVLRLVGEAHLYPTVSAAVGAALRTRHRRSGRGRVWERSDHLPRA